MGIKMKKDEFDFFSPIDSAWALFEQTGEISYYTLYKRLMEKVDNHSKKTDWDKILKKSLQTY